jgi:hypothetical protein
MDQMITEAIVIELNPNMNREAGLHVSLSWMPLIDSLKECLKSATDTALFLAQLQGQHTSISGH